MIPDDSASSCGRLICNRPTLPLGTTRKKKKKKEMGEKSLLERIGEEPRHLGPEKAEFQREGNLVFVSRSSFSLWAFDDPKQNSGQQKGK